MIKFNDGLHWYDKNGEPQHDADLRVARKSLLYPSVTSINKAMIKNPFLEKWKLNELVIAASENFRQPHETAETYANRIYEISLEKGNKAAEFGKVIHSLCDLWPASCMDAVALPYYEKFDQWAQANIINTLYSEKVLLDHQIGVAGRGDRCAILREYGRTMMDYKTQGIKPDDKGKKKPVFYPDWCRQLAFYAVCDAKETGLWPKLPACLSVVINSNEPDEVYLKLWTPQEVLSYYEDFVMYAYLYFKSRGKDGYYPVGKWSPCSIEMPTI